MNSMIWINGKLEPADSPALQVTDRGFQVGDGVFETLRVVDGRILELSLHAGRLAASARTLAIPTPSDLEAVLEQGIEKVCTAAGLVGTGLQVAIRVTLSRGPVDSRVLLPPDLVKPSLVIQAWQVEPPDDELLRRGLHVVISSVHRDPLSPLATVKTTSRAEFVYARLEARAKEADDALFCTTDGHLAEATSASLFLVDSNGLATPSLDCGILVSTTREWVIRTGGPAIGLQVREACLGRDDLFGASEAFLASSVAGVLPVTQVDGRPIGNGVPGGVTLRLRAMREAVAAPALV